MNGGAAKAGVVLAALALTGLLLAAPSAQAGCGGVETAAPKRKVASRPPLAIGDSSMLLALPALARVGYKANARGCRQFAEGLAVLRDARRHHRLPRQCRIGGPVTWLRGPPSGLKSVCPMVATGAGLANAAAL